MEDTTSSDRTDVSSRDAVRMAARIVAFACGGWWTVFGIGSALNEGADLTGLLAQAAVPGLILLATAAIAWYLEAFGGTLLIVEAIVVFIGYPVLTSGRVTMLTTSLVLLTMALPPLVAGILFVVSWGKSRALQSPP